MLTVLVLGLLVGMRHSLEADHLAAVTTLASRSASWRDRIKVAAVWGGGHAASLTILGGILVALGASLPDRVARGFELAAGLVVLDEVGFEVDVVACRLDRAEPGGVVLGCIPEQMYAIALGQRRTGGPRESPVCQLAQLRQRGPLVAIGDRRPFLHFYSEMVVCPRLS